MWHDYFDTLDIRKDKKKENPEKKQEKKEKKKTNKKKRPEQYRVNETSDVL